MSIDHIVVRYTDEDAAGPQLVRGTTHSAGYDLYARNPEHAPIVMHPGDIALVPTGLRLEIPVGWEGQIRPRSGLALNHGVTVLNAPGTIDSDYRGEVSVLLINHGRSTYKVLRHTRIAQIVFSRVSKVLFEESQRLLPTERDAGGFGSTGGF